MFVSNEKADFGVTRYINNNVIEYLKLRILSRLFRT